MSDEKPTKKRRVGGEAFAKRVATISGRTTKESKELVKSVLQALVESMTAGECVQFLGFGSFKMTQSKPRKYKSALLGGRKVDVPAKAFIRIKLAKPLAKAMIGAVSNVE